LRQRPILRVTKPLPAGKIAADALSMQGAFSRGNMETRRDERISQLIQALKRSDKLHLKEAATLLGVSEMTIRRDLNGHSGPVVLLGGYIVLEPRSATHYLLSDQNAPCG
jgi:hypothetical protein